MVSQIIAGYMMIEALNKKGYNAFTISVPSPTELLQIFLIAAPVFVTMMSKVAFYSLIVYFATTMGTHTVAAHQVMMQLCGMCTVFGEPFSQTAQSFMPELMYGVNQNLAEGGKNFSLQWGTPRDSSHSYANAPSPYLPSTPGEQPMTPSSASYLPGTPGGQPMTPGSGGLDIMSPVVGGDNEGLWVLPDILVNLRGFGEDIATGVVREVLPDGSCRIALGSSGNGEIVTALPSEIDVVVPRKSDKVKIMGGAQRGSTGKLIGVDGSDGIVKVDDTLDVKILDMNILAKLAQHN